jgi:hypothetical protein
MPAGSSKKPPPKTTPAINVPLMPRKRTIEASP